VLADARAADLAPGTPACADIVLLGESLGGGVMSIWPPDGARGLVSTPSRRWSTWPHHYPFFRRDHDARTGWTRWPKSATSRTVDSPETPTRSFLEQV
jgi:hypothetical protein